MRTWRNTIKNGAWTVFLASVAAFSVLTACEAKDRRFVSTGELASANPDLDGGMNPPESEISEDRSGAGDSGEETPVGGIVKPGGTVSDQASASCADDAGFCGSATNGDGPTCPGCIIEESCIAIDAINPDNPCQNCDPERDNQGWSPNDEATCDDGLFCTVNDSCSAGKCAGETRQCEDDVSCNGVSTCNEQTDTCSADVNGCGANAVCDVASDTCVTTCNGCLIDNVCISNGTEAAGNPCAVCNPALSTTTFSPAVGKSCGTGPSACSQQDTCDAQGRCQLNDLPEGTRCGNSSSSACNQPDSCDGNGQCLQRLAGNSTPCDDSAFCSVGDQCQGGECVPTGPRNCGANQICNEAVNQCQCQGCTIAGNCVASGASNPNDSCLVCDPTRSTTAFSESTGAICNRPIGAECTADSQCASNRCVLHYGDGDGDGFAPADALASAIRFCATGTASAVEGFTPVRPVSRANTDCLDTNINAFPGQTQFFGSPAVGLQPPFDYDCDGFEVDRGNNRLANCNDLAVPVCADRGGWSGTVPPCGIQETGIGSVSSCQTGQVSTVCVVGPGGPANRPCK